MGPLVTTAVAIALAAGGAAGRAPATDQTTTAPTPVAAATAAPVVATAPVVAATTGTTAAPAAATAPATAPASLPPPTVKATAPRAGALREPAPRPATDVRVQSRFAVKAKTVQLYGAAEYLSRGDFYNSPGARVGATYYPLESLGLELQGSHYWSSLNAEAERVKRTLGALPDSHAPAWLFLAGGRYSIGYGKLMIGGLGGAVHFEPQAFLHAGMHVHDGDVGPSGDAGLGLLVYLMPKLFVRVDEGWTGKPGQLRDLGYE